MSPRQGASHTKGIHTYELAFETIEQVMQIHQKTGTLHAEVSSGVMNLREPCRIEIKVVMGAVVSCIIVGSSGRRVTDKGAIQALVHLGRIHWTFALEQEVAVSPLAPTPMRPTNGYTFLPKRIASLDQEQMRSWSRLQRNIYALSDGTKSITKIAKLLSTTPELVEKAVRDLQVKGVIATFSSIEI